MGMDLTGIKNQNEYYTNHYFTSIFEENASDTISAWRKDAKESDESTPWAQFRDTAKQYYRIRDRYQHSRSENQSKEYISEMAALYLQALGYETLNSVIMEVAGGIVVPVFHEETKANGAPLLWTVLSVAEERGDDILQGKIFKHSESEDGDDGIQLENINDAMLSKMFFAGEEAPRWIIIIGINQIALIDRNKWNEKRYLQFDLDEIFSRHEETTFQALTVLLHKESLCPSEGSSILDTLDENSHKHSAGVSDSLKYALRECIELLGNEVIYDMKTRQKIDLDEHPVDATELTIECLRYMYRILFMLFIEARPELGYAPMKSQAYVQGYSLEGLRDICETVREESEEVSEGYYIDDTISELFKLIYKGYPGDAEAYKKVMQLESLHDIFTIEPLKAHIFDPEYTKLITNAKLRNCTMLQIIDLMSISRPSGRRERKGRISYSALGINQMGAVYEALLSYRGFLAKETLFEVKRAGDKFNELDVGYFVPERELCNYTEDERVRYEKGETKGQLRKYEKGTFIYRLAGREREKSASYYTPEVLTKCLVKYALKELLADKTADEILNLTVCEPAMGSAAFLNEAINQLAEAYLSKKQEELGETIAFDKRFEELQRVKMYIADRNVYGVDLNPIAVELAEVSLWLNTIYKGAYVPWFGTQLVCGNSLIGARRQVYSASKLQKGKWYEDAPERIMPGDKRKRSGVSRAYHFLMGNPGMANYTDKVIKGLEPENIKKINEWRKKFTEKYEEEDIKTLLRLSEIIDTLWEKTVGLRKSVESATAENLSVYGHEEADTSAHITIREKDAIFHRIYKSEGGENASPYARLKCAMDYWCALWFWPIDKAYLLPSRQEFLFEMALILEGGISSVTKKTTGQMSFLDASGKMESDDGGNMKLFVEGSEIANQFRAQYADLGVVNLDDLRARNERLVIANKIAEQQKFQHWELEFADLFAERGGFDLVIGNPPWIALAWNEQAILSDINPIITIKNFDANNVIKMRDNIFSNNNIKQYYCEEYMELSGTLEFLNAVANYPMLEKMKTNLFKCFIPKGWEISNGRGYTAYIHPEGIYSDAKGGEFRKYVYPKLLQHYQFENELKLFPEVHNEKEFGLNIYSNIETIGFVSISHLYAPITIDKCYEDSGLDKNIPGIKDTNDNWNIDGHKDRILRIENKELKLFARLFDGIDNPLKSKLPMLHSRQLLNTLSQLNQYPDKIADIRNRLFSTPMWQETTCQTEGFVKKHIHLPENGLDMIYTGPHIAVSNPMYQGSLKEGDTNRSYESIDLEYLPDEYLQRCKYSIACDIEKYIDKSPKTAWGTSYYNEYKLLFRRRLNRSGERTLNACIVPRKTSHVHAIIGIASKQLEDLCILTAEMSSTIFDFFIKITGKTDMYFDTLMQLPYITGKYREPLMLRALMLNACTSLYSELWNACWKDEMNSDVWGKKDKRLKEERFLILEPNWSRKSFCSNDYERRQLLIEIDVLTAMALGMTLNDLITVYRIQFPVLKQYESDTWYDINGKIVFTPNSNLKNVGVERKVWEMFRMEETIIHEYIDTSFAKDIDKCALYRAPFDRCEREKDYEEVWHNFEQRFKEK